MRTRVIAFCVGLVVIAVFAVNANAQKCECMGGEGKEMHGMGGMHDCGMMGDDHPMWKQIMGLGLDDKQKDALKELRSRVMKDMAGRRADMQAAGNVLQELLDKDTVDMKAVEGALRKKEGLRTEMLLAHVRAHEEMKAILTPEQRKKLKQLMEQGKPCCKMMHGREGHTDKPVHEHAH